MFPAPLPLGDELGEVVVPQFRLHRVGGPRLAPVGLVQLPDLPRRVAHRGDLDAALLAQEQRLVLVAVPERPPLADLGGLEDVEVDDAVLGGGLADGVAGELGDALVGVVDQLRRRELREVDLVAEERPELPRREVARPHRPRRLRGARQVPRAVRRDREQVVLDLLDVLRAVGAGLGELEDARRGLARVHRVGPARVLPGEQEPLVGAERRDVLPEVPAGHGDDEAERGEVLVVVGERAVEVVADRRPHPPVVMHRHRPRLRRADPVVGGSRDGRRAGRVAREHARAVHPVEEERLAGLAELLGPADGEGRGAGHGETRGEVRPARPGAVVLLEHAVRGEGQRPLRRHVRPVVDGRVDGQGRADGRAERGAAPHLPDGAVLEGHVPERAERPEGDLPGVPDAPEPLAAHQDRDDRHAVEGHG